MLSKKTIAKAMVPVMAASLSLATVLTAAPNVNAAKDKMQIWIWGGAGDKPTWSLFKKVVDDFNKTNKFNVEFEATVTENEAYKTKIATAMSSGQTPDVFETWPAGKLKAMVDAGRVYDITNEFNKDAEWKKRFANLSSDLKFGGKLYAIPNTLSLGALYYNKALFKKAGVSVPKTSDDLLAAVKKLKSKGITPFALGEKDAWTGAFLSEIIVNRIGGDAALESIVSGKGKWTDAPFIQAGNYIQSLVKAGAFANGFTAANYEAGNQLFKNNQAAMYFMGTWMGGTFCDKSSPVSKNVGVISFPTFKGGKGNASTWLGSPDNNFAVAKSTKNKKACVALIKAFSDPKYQKQLAEDSGSIIATTAKVNPAKANPVMIDVSALTEKMTGMFSAFDVALGDDIGGEYNNTIQAIFNGDDVKDAFAKLQTYTESKKK